MGKAQNAVMVHYKTIYGVSVKYKHEKRNTRSLQKHSNFNLVLKKPGHVLRISHMSPTQTLSLANYSITNN